MSRFEIVRTNAEQPWHLRIVSNGKITLRTENYSRMVGAERCLISAMHLFRWPGVRGLLWNVEGREKVFTLEDGSALPGLPTVLYVDER